MNLWEWIAIGEASYALPMAIHFVYIWRKVGPPWQ